MVSADNKYISEKTEIQRLIIHYIDKLMDDVPYEMITSNLELDLIQLLKMYEVRVEPECSSLLEQLTEYVKIIARLLNRKLLILVNICSYLDIQSVEELIKMCEYVKLPVLLIENCERDLEGCKTYIIDKDQCLIII